MTVSDSELDAHFDAAVALWQQRADLLPECGLDGPWQDPLASLETRYREHVATLASHAPQHERVREAWLRGGEGVATQVAAHVLLSSRQDALWNTLIGAVSRRDGAPARVVCGMLRFCSDDIVLPFARRLLELGRPWLTRGAANIVAKRGLTELAPLLRTRLRERGDELPELDLIDALGSVGDVDAGDELLELHDELDPDEHGLWRTFCVRAVCWMAHPRARALCAELIRSEAGDPEDTPSRFARIAGPEAADLLLERLEHSELPGWREAVALALGVVGSVRAVEPLLALMTEGDSDLETAADRALSWLSGVEREDEDEDAHEWWSTWWQEHAGEHDPQVRYADGLPIDIEREIAGLEHPLGDDREQALENLVLVTGARIPFDPFGYVEDQRAGVARWREWAAANADKLRPGAWWNG